MFGIFMESLVIFKLYTGLKFLVLLFAVSWAYLLLTEKDKRIRLMFVYAPLLILLLFLFPVSRKAFVAAMMHRGGASSFRAITFRRDPAGLGGGHREKAVLIRPCPS